MNEKKELAALLTPREAAAILRVSKETLNVWRCTRRYPLPFVKIGRSVRYRQADIERFIRDRTIDAGADI